LENRRIALSGGRVELTLWWGMTEGSSRFGLIKARQVSGAT